MRRFYKMAAMYFTVGAALNILILYVVSLAILGISEASFARNMTLLYGVLTFVLWWALLASCPLYWEKGIVDGHAYTMERHRGGMYISYKGHNWVFDTFADAALDPNNKPNMSKITYYYPLGVRKPVITLNGRYPIS